MAVVRVASFNVENLFARPKAFDPLDWSVGRPVLAAYEKINTLLGQPAYSDQDKARIRGLLVTLGVYYRNTHGAIRRRTAPSPQWAWLRANRGSFDRQPEDPTLDVEIIARGRADWIGWVELATEVTNEVGTRMTAQVIHDIDADILAIVEAEDRPSLVRLNADLLAGLYQHVMLVDGNDERGIDVGILTKVGFEIRSIRSHVDDEDTLGVIFSRDCADYQITTPSGASVHVLVNHFKSQSGGGAAKRRRQATRVRAVVDELTGAGEHVLVAGDFNEGPTIAGQPPPNLGELFDPAGPLRSCWDMPTFDAGPRPGSFDSCGLRNRLDYILLSPGLQDSLTSGHVFRRGLWGSRKTRPSAWDTYPDMTEAVHQASDHAAIVLNLDL